jgi:hypothetical protein
MPHWNFNRTYYYRGVDGFSTQDTATAMRHLCNDDRLNDRVTAWLDKFEQERREPGYMLGLLAGFIENQLKIGEWPCWSHPRRRSLDVRYYELAHVILTQTNEVQK